MREPIGRWATASPCAALALACLLNVPDVRAAPTEIHRDDEAVLVEALNHVRRQRLDAALDRLQALVSKNPKFRLAQLVYADMLLAKVQPIDRFGNLASADEKRIAEFQEEVRTRFDHHLFHPPRASLPENLLRLSPSQRRAVVVDVERSRLYLFENKDGRPQLIADYYASSGKNGAVKHKEGDRRTPVGVYFISGHIPDEKLPDFYGAGAFPIDYPNVWDRRLGKTGYGIWLHGVPSNTYSRAPRTSDGCVTLANADFNSLVPFMDVGRTPVVITKRVKWTPAADLAEAQTGLRQAIETWRKDWESLEPDRYAAHYSKSFQSGRRDYQQWISHKRRINGKKRYVHVQISDLSLLAYPGEPKLVVATFRQIYESDNYRGDIRKRQYWRLESDGVWRILYEGSA